LAWQKTFTTPWRHVRPELGLEEIQHAASGRDLDAFQRGEWAPFEVRKEDERRDSQGLFTFIETKRARIEAGLRTRRDAARAFLATIPQAVQEAVLPFASRQWHILALLARCPGADDLVASNPALAWAIASNWVFHRPAVKQPMRAARRLVRIRRREAAGWLGFPATPSAARQLAKVPAGGIGLAVILDLRRALHDEAGIALLRHLPSLRRGAVVLAASGDFRPYVTGTLLGEIVRKRAWRDNLRAFGTLRDAYVMTVNLDRRPPPPFESLAQLRGFHDALVEATNLRADAAYLKLEFPPPPLPGTKEILPLTEPMALLEEGHQMHHCAASYAAEVAEGRTYIYRVLAPERATLELRARPTGWTVAQLKGRFNEVVGSRTRAAVRSWVRGATNASAWTRHGRRGAGSGDLEDAVDLGDLALDDVPF